MYIPIRIGGEEPGRWSRTRFRCPGTALGAEKGNDHGGADTDPHKLLPAGGEGPLRRGAQAGRVPGGDAGEVRGVGSRVSRGRLRPAPPPGGGAAPPETRRSQG